MVSDATGQGHRLEIHVIGDAAAESAIVALEKAQVTREKRPVFAHCQVRLVIGCCFYYRK